MQQNETSNPTRVERRKALTNKEIINSAINLFVENGYVKTKVDDITSRADIGHGTFYKYFNNKHEVLTLLADELIDALDDYIHPKKKDLSVTERLFLEAKGILEFYEKNRDVLQILKEASMVEKEFEEKLLKIHDCLYKRIQYDIKGSIKNGFCRNIDEDVAVIALTGMMEGYANYTMQQPEGTVDIDTAATALSDIAYYSIFIK